MFNLINMINTTNRRENVIVILKTIKDIWIQILPKDRVLIDIENENIAQFVKTNFNIEAKTNVDNKLSSEYIKRINTTMMNKNGNDSVFQIV